MYSPFWGTTKLRRWPCTEPEYPDRQLAHRARRSRSSPGDWKYLRAIHYIKDVILQRKWWTNLFSPFLRADYSNFWSVVYRWGTPLSLNRTIQNHHNFRKNKDKPADTQWFLRRLCRHRWYRKPRPRRNWPVEPSREECSSDRSARGNPARHCLKQHENALYIMNIIIYTIKRGIIRGANHNTYLRRVMLSRKSF